MPKRAASNRRQGMRALNGAHEDIRVYKNFHLPTVWVEVLAAQRLIRNRWSVRKTICPLLKLLSPFRSAQTGPRSGLKCTALILRLADCCKSCLNKFVDRVDKPILNGFLNCALVFGGKLNVAPGRRRAGPRSRHGFLLLVRHHLTPIWFTA
jgi:hypothetical protein